MPHPDSRPVLHLMQGLPAAGKTTLARKLMANADRPVRYVGLDSLRLMLDGQTPTAWWDVGVEESTARAQAALVATLLADGCDVLVDGTHVSPAQVAPLRQAVAGLRFTVRVHVLPTPVDVCVARDAGRPHPIGAACIRRLAAERDVADGSGWRLTGEWLGMTSRPLVAPQPASSAI
ncbi:AAA family ATPase [Streptomyces sp. NPDC005863]|uniref:AAA family ATPase n=1 Tax=Streptomyces sp. NPDC005863 TaxID=3364735 RepID=UPI0036766D8E